MVPTRIKRKRKRKSEMENAIEAFYAGKDYMGSPFMVLRCPQYINNFSPAMVLWHSGDIIAVRELGSESVTLWTQHNGNAVTQPRLEALNAVLVRFGLRPEYTVFKGVLYSGSLAFPGEHTMSHETNYNDTRISHDV